MDVHPFTKPLAQFHSEFVSVLGKLPQERKMLEIAKRILIVVVAPFAYLALGFLSLVGRFCSFFSKDAKIVKPINTSEKVDEVNQLLLTEITHAKAISEIQSMKLFFNVSLNGQKSIKDYVVTKTDHSTFDAEFLNKKIFSIITELKELTQAQDSKELDVMWDILIKDKNCSFIILNGSISVTASSHSVSSGTWKNIPLERARESFNLVLKRIGRDVVPQLNDQLEFV